MSGIAVVVNPTKIPSMEHGRATLAKELSTFGVTDFSWLPTTAEDTGTGQARQAVESGAEMVLSWGGDGTVRSVAMGLLNSEVPLGILPGGTGNLVAKNLNLPGNLHGAVAVAMGGGAQTIDVNDVDLGDGVQRISLLICGMGLDAAIINSPERLKAMLGPGAYAAAAMKNLVGKAKPITLTMDNELPRRIPARMALVGNFGRMQMHVNLFDHASATDGRLAVFVAKLRGLGEVLSTTRGALLHRASTGKHSLQLSGKKVEIRTTEPWPREIDGDLMDPGDYMRVTVLPRALTVRVR
ncbi:MAG: diacylglycerol kinase family protein [Candidatus Nanopelagicales bacterium]|nr:diacylglycerol kinase family protein [Candidatus Nanopelagicales bacterium]